MSPMSLLTLPVESLREAQGQTAAPTHRDGRRERLAAVLTTLVVGLFTALAVWTH